MKVIATTINRKVLCEIDHCELEKFLGLYYGKMDRSTFGSTYKKSILDVFFNLDVESVNLNNRN